MKQDNNPQFSSGLSRSEKLGFVILVVLAIAVIYLGFRQMGNGIKGPFAERLAASLSRPKESEISESQQLESLKQKDTDKDGLSDYDELYLYQTSPYLADTDSDGASDKEEIERGDDPNCPKGKDCAAGASGAGQGGTTPSVSVPVTPVPSVEQILLQSLFGDNPDPKTLRDFLTKQGADKKTLDLFSDSELLAIFKDLVKATSTPAVNLLPPTGLDLSKVSAQDLRALLLKQGAAKETLDKISDEDLMKMLGEIK